MKVISAYLNLAATLYMNKTVTTPLSILFQWPIQDVVFDVNKSDSVI